MDVPSSRATRRSASRTTSRTPRTMDESAKNIKALDAGNKAAVVDNEATDKDETSDAARSCVFEPRARIYLQTGGRARLRRDTHHPAARRRPQGHRRQQQRDPARSRTSEDKIAPGISITDHQQQRRTLRPDAPPRMGMARSPCASPRMKKLRTASPISSSPPSRARRITEHGKADGVASGPRGRWRL